MKKLFVALTALALMACGNVNKPADGDAAEQDSDFMLDGPSMEYNPTEHDLKMNELAVQQKAVVEKTKEIYDAVKKAYSNTGEYGTDTDLDADYCSNDWRASVDAIHQKDMTLDDMGFFCADYWVMGQDAQDVHATDIKLEKIILDEEPWQASVTLNLHNCGSTTPVRVDLVYEDNTWKVDDLTDLKNDFDWKQEMKDYLSK